MRFAHGLIYFVSIWQSFDGPRQSAVCAPTVNVAIAHPTRLIARTCRAKPAAVGGSPYDATFEAGHFSVYAERDVADGYWYKDIINGSTVGLTTTSDGGQYVTAPAGQAITGAIVVINGIKTNLVLTSNGKYNCCSDGVLWRECASFRGQYDSSFVRTGAYIPSPTASPTALPTLAYDITFWAVTSHSSPVSDLIWVLRRLLGLRPNARVCARTFKGCSDNFPGVISCCKEEWSRPDQLLYRQGPGESNPGRHFQNLRTFFELFKNIHSSHDTDFIYCDLPPAT
jgi:hypothetical protein